MKFHKAAFDTLSRKEWLVTNGIGGYASSSVAGANTRRYHGLLVASMHPPTDRIVLVSKVEESIMEANGRQFQLSSNQYPGTVHPDGYTRISEFIRHPLPCITFKDEDFFITKEVFMVYQSNTTVVEYQNHGDKEIILKLNPFYVCRDYHSLFSQQDKYDFYHEENYNDVTVIYPYHGAAPIYVQCEGGGFRAEKIWYKDFIYEKETQRGLDDREDACSIGTYIIILKPGQKRHIVFTTESEMLHQSWEQLKEIEYKRIASLTKWENATTPPWISPGDQQFFLDLITSGDQFIVQRESTRGYSIIAGYHWFTDWGRDTMIAMRGLVISQGKKELAKNIINTFLQYLKDGLIPNRFPDQGETPEYNTIDASLWLFIVLYEYQEKFDDPDFIRACLPKLKEIIMAYRDGTHFKIHMTEEALIFGGEGLTQLTWMDAKVGDYVVTPRIGCPVEINALWYNALHIYIEFLNLCKLEDTGWEKLLVKVKDSFRKYFINAKGYLNDVIIPGEFVDDAVRPNQVYALSLPFSVLHQGEMESILKCITDHLLTPYGLRSLSMDHPAFIGFYGGDQWHRDKAYHQGTVWAYLMGEYLKAYLRTNDYSQESKKHVLELMQPLRDHFYNEDCINGISEIFDGENPQDGKGCIHQAWSVGMLLTVFRIFEKNGS